MVAPTVPLTIKMSLTPLVGSPPLTAIPVRPVGVLASLRLIVSEPPWPAMVRAVLFWNSMVS